MSLFKPTEAWVRSTLGVRLGRFARHEDGSITILTIFIIIMMVMVGGIQLDFMRHEMERTKLQAAADRAVLAAADLDQTLAPADVVDEYFAKSGMSDYLSSVTIENGLNFRTVTVKANNEMKTQFLGRFGFPTLDVPALSKAEERVEKVEISLVLDVSGSMKNNSKLTTMKDAAKTFIDTVLRPETKNNVSLSLIPYSEQVNVGPDIFNALWVDTRHDFSYCIDVPDGHFVQTQMTPGFPWDQTQHFQWNTYSIESGYQQNTLHDTVCPRAVYERVRPISQDGPSLKAQIDLFQPRAGTAIYMGMKWGTALLDPSFRETTASLVSDSVVESTFADRPADYSDRETLKTIVLMTDGQNSNSQRISTAYYNSSSEVVHWSKWNFNYYLSQYIKEKDWHRYYYTRYTAEKGNTLMDNICSAAKDEGIVIWTIGFEVNDTGADVMKKCASSPSHFFRVEGVELTDAFSAIASQINQLRLTQ
ncbi:pilus assembly protein TadG-related protein [Roseobacter sp. GAI101]|uniref:pilus assembly protein TadG-related protein n=1 Tax=Roseobacter sp. (strain GAI101) TaxID=391589 RepID=UPI000187226E|nr:VWA domain-containing protein [Roseobacter sp. GAI101]EEB83818.1 conserved hypothetical protein [Roseobacter sp. GAI101]